MALERLQKILSNSGHCSRRAAEELIKAGKVSVNDRIISIGDKADASKDKIQVSGKPIGKDRKRYFAFYKPRNVMTTLSDPSGKPTVMRFIEGIPERVFPVGRLDYDAEGLLILTNDGDFANKIMHPRYETVKTYEAELRDRLRAKDLAMLKGKVKLKDGFVKIESSRMIHDNIIEISIHEGRHKVVKRIFKELGFYVKRLKRTKVGPLMLGRMKPGEIKEIPEHILNKLK